MFKRVETSVTSLGSSGVNNVKSDMYSSTANSVKNDNSETGDSEIFDIVENSEKNGSVCFVRLVFTSDSALECYDVFDLTVEFDSFFDNYKKEISVSDNVQAFNSLSSSLTDLSYPVVDFYNDLMKIHNPDYNIMDEDENSRLCLIASGLASFASKRFKLSSHKRSIRVLTKNFSNGYMKSDDNYFFNIKSENQFNGSMTLVGVPFYDLHPVSDSSGCSDTSDDVFDGASPDIVFTDPVSDVVGSGYDLGSKSNQHFSKNEGKTRLSSKTFSKGDDVKRVSRKRNSGFSNDLKKKEIDRASQANLIKSMLDDSNKNSETCNSRYFVCDPTLLDSSRNNRMNDSLHSIDLHQKGCDSNVDAVYHSSDCNVSYTSIGKESDEFCVSNGISGVIYMRYTTSPFSVTQMREVDLTRYFLNVLSNTDKKINENLVIRVLKYILNRGANRVLSSSMNSLFSSVDIDFLSELKEIVERSGFVFNYKNTSFEVSVNVQSFISYYKKYNSVSSLLSNYGKYI